MAHLVRKTITTIKDEGLQGLSKKARIYTASKILGKLANPPEEMPQEQEEVDADEKIKVAVENIQQGEKMVDVLFINGCDSSVPHPARYRVTHQREQLNANNISSEEVYYIELRIEQVKYANMFVFFRCPYTETIGDFIKLAKSLNKVVLFDIDDLVIDTKYTDTIKYIGEMTPEEKRVYDDGVIRMGKTAMLCDAAITTTERLAEELSHYVPEVYINRNTASERMWELSENVNIKREDKEVRIGYFSGSITHNDDFALVMKPIIRLFEKYDNVRLYLVGELDLPEELKGFSDKIEFMPFVDWERLPELIGSVDINIAPLEESIFNEAKSENKWVEAALVNVVTVASDVGAFKRMIEHNKTGFLCSDEEDWFVTLEKLVLDSNVRNQIAKNANTYVKENCLTLSSSCKIAKYIKKKMRPSIVFVLPSTEISGGIMVALKHAGIFKSRGYTVTIIASNPSKGWMEFDGYQFPVLSLEQNLVEAWYNKMVATMWSTLNYVEEYKKVNQKFYLVQNYEVDFYEANDVLRQMAMQSYNASNEIQYCTISKWCKSWLLEKYDKEARYAPNGIYASRFQKVDRDYNGKIRILIEGDCAVNYKKVDESFEITNKLDKNLFEVWYMSYNEKPKSWYRIDRFLHKVPYSEVGEIYGQCHILLKSSVLESFSYPPLEMMASGGAVVVVKNGGNSEYIENELNCLTYESGNIDAAIACINRIVEDGELRSKLRESGDATAKIREWDNIEKDIFDMYQ